MVFGSLDSQVVAVMIPIVAIIGGIAIAIVAVIVEGKKKELVHRERLIAIEKGVELPPLEEKEEKRPTFLKNRSSGLVMTFIGIALSIALWVESGDSWVWGLMPLAIGVGLLVSSTLERKDYEKVKHEKRDL